jgi:hypothetical protein
LADNCAATLDDHSGTRNFGFRFLTWIKFGVLAHELF